MYRHNDSSAGIRRALASFVSERSVRWQAFFGVLFACLAAASSVGLVGVAGWFIAASALAGISGAAAFIVAYPSSGIRAFAVTRVLFRYLERLTNHRVTFSLLSRLRVHFFERSLKISPERFGRYRSGDLLARATSDIDALDNVFPRVIVPTIAAFVVCAGSILFLSYFSPLLSLLLAAGCVVAGIALPLVSWLDGRGSGEGISTAKSRLRTEIVEAVEGLPEIRSYGAGEVVAARLNVALDSVRKDERRAKLTDVSGTSFGVLAAQGTTLTVLVVGLILYETVGLEGPILALAVLLATGVFEQLGALPAAYRSLGTTRAAAKRLDEIFSPEEDDLPAKREFRVHENPLEVTLSGVTLRYGGRERDALKDFSMRVGGGEVAVISGASGSGKTTLLRMISGELVPNSGTVEIGGDEIVDIAPDSLAEHVSYASQDEHIFDATLRENLQIAAPDATDDVLLYVLDIVGLSGFYAGLEDGLDTHVGTHGREISGGQRRRLSVARALLRRPDVLLLDEPTGSLDEGTARGMLRGIRENLPGATVVISTHDPALVTSVIPEAKAVALS